MNAELAIKRRELLMKRYAIPDSAPFAIVSSFCKRTDVEVKAGNRDVISFINTLDIDCDREVVIPAGADMEYLRKNTQVYVDHQMSTDKAVGFVRDINPFPRVGDQYAWEARTRIYNKTGNRLGDDILTMARENQIGFSIGFLATDYGPPTGEETKWLSRLGVKAPQRIIREYKVFEYSFTAQPCNVNCQGVASQPDDKGLAEVDRMVTKGLIARESAAALGAPITAKRKFHAVTEPRRVLVVV